MAERRLFTCLIVLQCRVTISTDKCINLLFFLPTAASALVCHARSGCLDKPVLRSAIPWAVAAAVAGAWIATALDPELLRKPFGGYLLLSGVSLLWPKHEKAS